MVEELLLGDNPFIGVSHLAQEKARDQIRDASLENKVRVFEAAVSGGATGFTFSTDKSNLELLTYLSTHRKDLLNAVNYYILTPYAQSYVRKANIGGTPLLLRSTLDSILRNPLALWDTLIGIASKRMESSIGFLIKTELIPYLDVLPNERVKAVFLHEIVTDTIMAFGLMDLLRSLEDYVKQKIGLSFGLHTKNFGYLQTTWPSAHNFSEYIMTAINPFGYMMAPDKETVEEAVVDLGKKTKIIAINVLASGAANLDEAVSYLAKYRSNLYAVTSASMNPHRICENFQKLSRTLM